MSQGPYALPKQCQVDATLPSKQSYVVKVVNLPANTCSRSFLTALRQTYDSGKLRFFGAQKALQDPAWFEEHLRPLKRTEWIVYAKAPFAGPEAVLTYLSRYTHRVAISNRRLVRFSDKGVTFRYKDYRNGKTRWRSMTLESHEFIRRFLLHILPKGLHRIRHYGLLANTRRKDNLKQARRLLGSKDQGSSKIENDNEMNDNNPCAFICRQCGKSLIVTEILAPQHAPRAPPQRNAA